MVIAYDLPEFLKSRSAGSYDSGSHLSDVIEVIKETDPCFTESNARSRFNQSAGPHKIGPMYAEMPAPAVPQPSISIKKSQIHVKIIEQPASKALRFRYVCEGRSAGSIPGASSTPENKTYPEIQVVGYQGRAVVVVSCVTKDAPYKAHPHSLVGREGCKRGVCTLEIPPDTMRVQFSNLGIQCVKKRDIEEALRQREEIRVDPFRQGYSHRNQPTSIDLNAVRLCFQVFLEGDTPNKFNVPLAPIVSEVIYDKKAMSDLTIVKLSDCVSFVDGGRKDMILLCEKVAKEDIQIRFYEEKEGKVVWEGLADFQPSQVHKQTAIWFRTPRYRTLDVTEPVRVLIQLRRPSDGATSEPLPFELLPLDAVSSVSEKHNKRKRAKIDDPSQILRQIAQHEKMTQQHMALPMINPIKKEPQEAYGGQIYGTLSPNYTPSPGVSPQYVPNPIDAPLQSPDMNCQYQPNIHYNILQLRVEGGSNNWNFPTPNIDLLSQIPSTSATLGNAQNQGFIMNLDTQQVNSAELACTIAEMDILNPLPDISGLSMSDVQVSEVGQDGNMTDSLTRLTNERAGQLLDNISYPGN
ncbi:embryonic polarity protein dorsal-like isoform X2 [Cylas formicarius]|uniref:embryonic polarity protein dorsal-like isoform X2 n=1 Tax=Cylas formicarius TaxID=197179 RepID=UPI002958A25E|nr:embryonic polarity protein dorsal-like isoform X2 [Cylas formicarius]